MTVGKTWKLNLVFPVSVWSDFPEVCFSRSPGAQRHNTVSRDAVNCVLKGVCFSVKLTSLIATWTWPYQHHNPINQTITMQTNIYDISTLKNNCELENAFEYIILIIIEEHAFLPRLSLVRNWSAASSCFSYRLVGRIFYNKFTFPPPSTSLQSKTEKLTFFFSFT